mgnify:CR=1 FL=1
MPLGSVIVGRGDGQLGMFHVDASAFGEPCGRQCVYREKKNFFSLRDRHHGAKVTCLAGAARGNVCVSAATDAVVKLWDARDGHCLSTLVGHGSPIQFLAVGWFHIVDPQHENVICAVSEDGVVITWQSPFTSPVHNAAVTHSVGSTTHHRFPGVFGLGWISARHICADAKLGSVKGLLMVLGFAPGGSRSMELTSFISANSSSSSSSSRVDSKPPTSHSATTPLRRNCVPVCLHQRTVHWAKFGARVAAFSAHGGVIISAPQPDVWYLENFQLQEQSHQDVTEPPIASMPVVAKIDEDNKGKEYAAQMEAWISEQRNVFSTKESGEEAFNNGTTIRIPRNNEASISVAADINAAKERNALLEAQRNAALNHVDELTLVLEHERTMRLRDVDEGKEELRRQTSEIAHAADESRRVNADLREAKQVILRFKLDTDDIRARHERLLKRREDLDRELRLKRERLEEAEASLKDEKSRSNAFEQRMNDMTLATHSLEQEIARLNDDKAARDVKVDSLERRLAERSASLEALENSLLARPVGGQSAAAASSTSAAPFEDARYRALALEISSLREKAQQHDELLSNHATLMARATANEGRVADLQARFRDAAIDAVLVPGLRDDIARLSSENTQLYREREQGYEELRAVKDQVEKLLGVNHRLEVQIEVLRTSGAGATTPDAPLPFMLNKYTVNPVLSTGVSTSTVQLDDDLCIAMNVGLPGEFSILWKGGGAFNAEQRCFDPVAGYILERFDAVLVSPETLRYAAMKGSFLARRCVTTFEHEVRRQDALLSQTERQTKARVKDLLTGRMAVPAADPAKGEVDWLYALHGCGVATLELILRHGFAALHRSDGGYFGRGIYTTINAEYAARYSDGSLSPDGLSPPVGRDSRWMPSGCYPVVLCAVGVCLPYAVTPVTDGIAFDHGEGNDARVPFAAAGVLPPEGRPAGGHQEVRKLLTHFYGGPGEPSKALRVGNDTHIACVSHRTGYHVVNPENATFVEVVSESSELVIPIGVLWVRRVPSLAANQATPSHRLSEPSLLPSRGPNTTDVRQGPHHVMADAAGLAAAKKDCTVS